MPVCNGPCKLNKNVDAFELRKDSGTRRKICLDCSREDKRKRHADKLAKAGKTLRPPPDTSLIGTLKFCSGCEEEHDLSLFAKRSDSADGYNNFCKKYKAEYLKQWKSDIETGERSRREDPPIEDGRKQCTVCDEWKLLEEYTYRQDSSKYRNDCNICRRETNLDWQHRKIEASDNFKLRRETSTFTRNVISSKKKKSDEFEKIVGLTPVMYRKWFEFRFEIDGEMSWSNYGVDKMWTVDHVVALSLFDLTIPEEFKLAFDWKNTQPLRDNIEKKNSFRAYEFEKHVEAVKQFIDKNNDSLKAEYQGLSEMADWLREKLGYGKNLTDEAKA